MSRDLLDCIHFVKKQRSALPHIDASSGNRYAETKASHDIAITKMVALISAELPKAKFGGRSDLATVSIAGIRASSTSGIDGALSNWVAAAYRKLDKQP